MVKQMTIISGKGGTGKTTICSAFASLAENAVVADCDVDAADMHLILKPDIIEANDFYGLKVANIDADLCTRCKECVSSCRFAAISENVEIDAYSCEGCAVCEYVCPQNAMSMIERKAGEYFSSMTRFGPMAHAKLGIGEEASGKLVSTVRKSAMELVMSADKGLVVIDGPPGTGCAVIAAITGVDLVLIVTEPTVSGIHDLERVLEVAEHFRIPAAVCINKYDINKENTQIIQDYCIGREIEIVGLLPYDRTPVDAMLNGKTVIEFAENEFTSGVLSVWENVHNILFSRQGSPRLGMESSFT
ncbi:ATP-binding protein [Methanolobus sp. ZRKC3]|uniref:ATP-binding protein n=1 Tax=Methanolobus sp. ZRKC3 TaxID=3125786 RepID=UPI003252ECD9